MRSLLIAAVALAALVGCGTQPATSGSGGGEDRAETGRVETVPLSTEDQADAAEPGAQLPEVDAPPPDPLSYTSVEVINGAAIYHYADGSVFTVCPNGSVFAGEQLDCPEDQSLWPEPAPVPPSEPGGDDEEQPFVPGHLLSFLSVEDTALVELLLQPRIGDIVGYWATWLSDMLNALAASGLGNSGMRDSYRRSHDRGIAEDSQQAFIDTVHEVIGVPFLPPEQESELQSVARQRYPIRYD